MFHGQGNLHYVHTYFPLRNNPLVEGVNTEAARVEMYKLQ